MFFCHFPWANNFQLCQICFKKFRIETAYCPYSPGSGFVGRFRHFWLRSWVKKDEFVERFLRHLKQNSDPYLAKDIVEFYLSIQPNELFQNPWDHIIYPSRNHKKDHAYGLAMEWSKILGIEATPLLLTDPTRKQALQGVGDRKKIQFLRPKESIYGRILFVDDILTTGATGLASIECVSQLEIFAIWTVFYRPRLFDS